MSVSASVVCVPPMRPLCIGSSLDLQRAAPHCQTRVEIKDVSCLNKKDFYIAHEDGPISACWTHWRWRWHCCFFCWRYKAWIVDRLTRIIITFFYFRNSYTQINVINMLQLFTSASSHSAQNLNLTSQFTSGRLPEDVTARSTCCWLRALAGTSLEFQ
jgi:hypothetical protein